MAAEHRESVERNANFSTFVNNTAFPSLQMNKAMYNKGNSLFEQNAMIYKTGLAGARFEVTSELNVPFSHSLAYLHTFLRPRRKVHPARKTR